MPYRPIAASLLACLFSACVVCPFAHALEPGEEVRFAAKTLDDRVVKAEDYRGKLLVVHFWSTWHRPSVRQLETLRAVLDHTAPLGVAMVGICLDDPEEGTVMMQTMLGGATAGLNSGGGGATWDHVLAHSQMPALDTRFFSETYAIPAVWVVSPDGHALWQGHPADLPEQLIGFLETHPPTALPDPSLADAEPSEDAGDQDDDAGLNPIEIPVATTGGQEIDATAAIAAVEAKAASVEDAKRALLNADAAWNQDPPDYAGTLAALAAIEAAAYDDAMIAAHGQRWQRVMQGLEPDALNAFLAARDALPEAGFTLDAYLAAAAAVDPMEGRDATTPDRVERRVARGLRDVERERHAEAYKQFSSVLNIALGFPEADDALIHVLRYEADEALMKAIAIEDADMVASGKFMMAKGHAEGFREEQAAELLREILRDYAETPTAAKARELLESLDLPE